MFIVLSKSFSDILHHQYYSNDDGEYLKSFCSIALMMENTQEAFA